MIIQMGFAQTASVLRGLAMKYKERSAPNFSRHPEGMSRHLVNEKGVFIENFLIARRRGKTNFVSNLHPFWLQAGTFLDLLDGLGAQVGRCTDFTTILGCFWGGFGRPWGPFGLPLGAAWRPRRPKNQEKERTVSPRRCEASPAAENRMPRPCLMWLKHSK